MKGSVSNIINSIISLLLYNEQVEVNIFHF